MRAKRWMSLMGAVMAMGWAAGCVTDAEEPGGPEGPMGQVVPPGKADNFISSSAQEYMLEGLATVTIEEELAGAPEETKLARVQELIALKHIVIGWFLGQYIAEKDHDDANHEYGGWGGLTKNGAYSELGVEAVDATTYQFTFRQEIGGPTDLIRKIPTTVGDDGHQVFELVIGKISNEEMAQLEVNNEWYRQGPWDGFNPETVDAERLETLTLAIWPEEQSLDGWFDYNRLFEDGRVTIDVHFGWDYHGEYHLRHSQDVYEWLVSTRGFDSPVERYEDYTRTSGPLTKTIEANGQPVLVEIGLFWGRPGTDTDPDTDAGGKVLEDDMRASFRDHEVIMFSGHSGPFYGFALANWRKTEEGDLDDSEVASLELPSDTYQLVIAEGCDTYALGQAFRDNPAKPNGANLDVVTTTSFSNATTAAAVRDSLSAIIGDRYADAHEPVRFTEYLRDMDNNSSWFDTMYGAHGIDDNPHGHPYGVIERLCAPCEQDAECGGVGNACTKLNDSETFCTYECTADDGCPDGYHCMDIAEGSYLTTKRCAPVALTCQSE